MTLYRLKMNFFSLLCLFFALCGGWGCIQWIPVTPVTDNNSPPFFVLETLFPESSKIIPTLELGGEDSIEFRIAQVQDADVKDTLRFYWFVNGVFLGKEIVEPDVQNLQKIRNIRVARRIKLRELEKNKVNIVEVFVLDREENNAQEKDWGGAATDNHQWFVDYR